MKTEIPDIPVSLGADEATAMLQSQIKKHAVAVILLHWFNAFVWLFGVVTGLALVSSPAFRVVPLGYVDFVRGVFGGRAAVLDFHVAVGIAWIVVFVVYGVFGFRTFLRREVLEKEMSLDWDDGRWLYVRVLGILGRTRAALPPQGSYNAGQKLFAVMIYAMVPLVMLSGLVIAFRLFGPAAIGWAVVLHFVAVGAVVAGLMVHVYMGAVFPEEKPAFFSMITGNVNELFAYRHHFKWWREVKLAQRAWEEEQHAGGPPRAAR